MDTFISFLTSHSRELFLRLAEHLQLTFAAVFIAATIGYPLAALTFNSPRLRVLIQSLCNLFQTIPSLALLALLLPLLGLGFLPAVVALVLYAVLPIVRSTYTALSDAEPDQIDAGRVLGMTSLQLLWYVRLPSGLPQLISGLRIAFVWSVGTATLSAFIGAGGLGQFITTGLARNSTPFLLLGAIPAALLALFIDYFLGQLEEAARHWKNGTVATRQVRFFSLTTRGTYKVLNGLEGYLLVMILIILIICAIPSRHSIAPASDKPLIRIGAKNFVEQMILGEILAQKIESTGNYRVERKFGLGSTALIHGAIVGGDIDLYVEYSGTAEQNILRLSSPLLLDPVHTELARLYREKFDLLWLDSLGFSNSYAVVISNNRSTTWYSTLSSFAPVASNWTAGLNAEFIDRPDGYPALQKIYNLKFREVKTLDAGLTYPALDTGAVGAIVVFSTDGQLANTEHYRVLEDDRHAFPRYDASPVLRNSVAEKHPDLVGLLSGLADKITEDTMRRLNHEVESGKREPAQVARDFLNSLPK